MTDRMKLLEAVAEAARKVAYRTGDDWRPVPAHVQELMDQELMDAVRALDALPAQPQPQGETVEVRAVVFATPDGETWTVYGRHCDEDEQLYGEARRLAWEGESHIATLIARVPLPVVPTVSASVTEPRP